MSDNLEDMSLRFFFLSNVLNNRMCVQLKAGCVCVYFQILVSVGNIFDLVSNHMSNFLEQFWFFSEVINYFPFELTFVGNQVG